MASKAQFLATALIGLLAVSASPAAAQGHSNSSETTTAPAETAAASPFGEAVSAKGLASIVGQADINQVVQAENKSEVSHNSVSNSDTGTIAFDGQAFQSMSGLAIVNANTGNNVSINSSLNVNISIHP